LAYRLSPVGSQAGTGSRGGFVLTILAIRQYPEFAAARRRSALDQRAVRANRGGLW
jgi:hypothetical protein